MHGGSANRRKGACLERRIHFTELHGKKRQIRQTDSRVGHLATYPTTRLKTRNCPKQGNPRVRRALMRVMALESLGSPFLGVLGAWPIVGMVRYRRRFRVDPFAGSLRSRLTRRRNPPTPGSVAPLPPKSGGGGPSVPPCSESTGRPQIFDSRHFAESIEF